MEVVQGVRRQDSAAALMLVHILEGLSMSRPIGNIAAQGYDRRERSLATGYVERSAGKTVQSQKDEADIMTMIRQFGVLGTLPQNLKVPFYGDFTEITDFQSALELVAEADRSFHLLPSEFRAELDNDPQRFLEWIHDPANRARGESLGLIMPSACPPGTPPAGT